MGDLSIADYFVFFAEMILFFIGTYYLGVSVYSLSSNKRGRISSKLNSFAIVIAAHNEESVIVDLIKSLKNINYDKDKYDIFVVADNCTDSTACKAKENGVFVFERFNRVKVGKGFALEYAFEKIFALEKKYDFVAIFDADNIVEPNFLLKINGKINRGYKAVQGYLDSKNPYDSWLTFSYSLWYWINNRVSQLSRDNLDIGCRLGGTGLAIETDLIKKYGWGATCLAEDTEFTLKLALNDIKVGWCHDAVVYDEKPAHMQTSCNQRIRWMQGLSDISRRFVKPLINKAVSERKASPLHMLFNFWGDTLYPICVSLFALLDILAIIMHNNPSVHFMLAKMWVAPLNFLILNLFVFCNIALVLGGLYIDKKLDKRIVRHLVGFLVYILSWIPIGIIGAIQRDNKEWFHTPHTVSKSKHDT